MLLSSLAPPGKWDVASGVEGGRGRPTQGVPWGVAAYFSHFP